MTSLAFQKTVVQIRSFALLQRLVAIKFPISIPFTLVATPSTQSTLVPTLGGPFEEIVSLECVAVDTVRLRRMFVSSPGVVFHQIDRALRSSDYVLQIDAKGYAAEMVDLVSLAQRAVLLFVEIFGGCS